MHPYLTTGRADVLAHRGASDRHPPGNTGLALTAAWEAGADHLEIDVQRTRDGEIVIFHDDDLADHTTGRGAIADHPWAELSELDVRGPGGDTRPGRLIRLVDAFAELPDAYWNIDVKTDDAVADAARLLRRHVDPERVCVAAFDRSRLGALRAELGDGWCWSASQAELARMRMAGWLRLPIPEGVDVVQAPRTHLGVTVVDERFVTRCHDRGVAVHVWTVDDPWEIAELYAMGVDAVVTNRPEVALELGPRSGHAER